MKRTVYSPTKELIIRRRFEITSRRSHNSLVDVLRHLPVAACIIDHYRLTYLDVNQLFATLLGHPLEQILNQRVEDLPGGLRAVSVEKIISSINLSHPPQDFPLMLFDHQGRWVKTLINANPIIFRGRKAVMMTLIPVRRDIFGVQKSESDSRLAAAGEVSRSMIEQVDPQEIYQRLAASLYQLIPQISTIFISLHDARREKLVCAFAEHNRDLLDPSQIPTIRLGESEKSLQAEVMRSQEALVVDDLETIYPEALRKSMYRYPGKPARSAAYLPMTAKGTMVGLVQVQSPVAGLFDPTDASLLGMITNTAAIAIYNVRLAQNLERTTQDLTNTYEAAIDGWTRALELRDFTTERHTQRVVALSMELGKKLGLNSNDLLRIRRGAQLHDIGKMGIPDKILLKPGPLDDSEWRIMRRHPVYAYELLRPIPHFNDIIDIPYCHHEKWDGSGYPRRLKGEEIPMTARIFSIVDVWDALSSNRPYRSAWPANQVMDYIHYQTNKQFEPRVAHAFLELMSTSRAPVPGGGIRQAGQGSIRLG